jgi:hypothetical protein
MIPDGFKCYIQSTYRETDSNFRFLQKPLENILEWGESWQPDSIQLFKLILRRIKENKKCHKKDRNDQNENGWYVSLPLAGTNEQMVLFFEPPKPQEGIKYYTIYDFKISVNSL